MHWLWGREVRQSREEPVKHSDLGPLNGAVLLFGGPYSNFQATQALFDAARRIAIPPTHMICTGDVVAYGGSPSATAAWIRASGASVVAGNCEKQLAAGAENCGCGFASGTACDLLSRDWYRHAARHVSAADRRWMANCPDIVTFHHQGARYAVIHGGLSDIARYVWPTSPLSVFQQEWTLIEAAIGPVDHVIAGHCGLPFLRKTPQGRWINAGVIGMPPNDGAQQTRYAVLDGGEVLFHHLKFDVEAAVRAMELAGLTQGYHLSLRSGYWPSEEVLPPALRSSSRARG
jgi:predicted phosphodiesterase